MNATFQTGHLRVGGLSFKRERQCGHCRQVITASGTDEYCAECKESYWHKEHLRAQWRKASRLYRRRRAGKLAKEPQQ